MHLKFNLAWKGTDYWTWRVDHLLTEWLAAPDVSTNGTLVWLRSTLAPGDAGAILPSDSAQPRE